MKRTLCLILFCLLLFLSACSLTVPTKDASDETDKPRRTSAAGESASDSKEPAGLFPEKELLPGLKDEYDPADYEQNNVGIIRTAGRIVHAYGGTWFVQAGMDNDGRMNGHVGSENIYFLSDEAGAEPVLVYAFPSLYEDEIQQWTIEGLMPGPRTPEGRFLYLSAQTGRGGSLFYRLDLATKELRSLDYSLYSVWANGLYNRSGDKLYFTARKSADPNKDGYYEREAFVLDLQSGSIEPFDDSLPVSSGKETAYPIGISGDYLYYCIFAVRDGDYVPYGFYRMDLESRKEEEVAPVTCSDIDFAFCLGNYLIYNDDLANENVFISTESGQEVLRLSDREYDFDDEAFTVSGDVFYFFENGSLMTLNVLTGEKTRLIAGNEREALLITRIGSWIWFSGPDDEGIYRVSETGRILPASPLVALPDWDSYRRGDYFSQGGWEYLKLPACIAIRGYRGDAAEVTVPAELSGQKVTIVSLDLRDDPSVEKLVIPEGIISLHGISASETLKELQLPHSLEHMVVHGYDFTLHLSEDTVIRYAGTVSEWQALFDFNRSYHDCATDSSRCEVEDVICLDGVWHRHGTYDESKNLLVNPGFESGSEAPWIINDLTGLSGAATILQVDEDPEASLSGSRHLHFWREAGRYIDFEAEQDLGCLESGDYRFRISLMGGDADDYTIYAYVKIDGRLSQSKWIDITEWQEWDTGTLYFNLYRDSEVTVGIRVRISNQAAGGGAWGMIDDASLIRRED